MALLTDRADFNIQHAQDYALKLKFEAGFISSLTPIFRRIGEDFESYYLAHQDMPNIEHYKEDIIGVLRGNYDKIAKKFKFNIRSGHKAMSDEEIARRVDVQLSAYIREQSINKSAFIIGTIADNLQQNIDTVIIEAATQGIAIDKRGIAAAVKKRFRKDEQAQAQTIATTETNLIANGAKFTEAEIFSQATEEALLKVWASLLDGVTRPAHIFADGQEVEIDMPFIVGGEKLMFPSDTSLGASLGNIINCRCDVLFTTKKLKN